MEELDHIRINEFLAPESVDFKHSHYVQINGLYHSYLLVPSDGYKNRVTPGWLSLLVNAGEGIDIDFFLQKQPKDKIQQRLGQQIRINRSKLKDASDTNTDYDDLDSAIRSGYFLKQGLANNEDFYYMNLLITITASTLEELQWRIQEIEKAPDLAGYELTLLLTFYRSRDFYPLCRWQIWTRSFLSCPSGTY